MHTCIMYLLFAISNRCRKQLKRLFQALQDMHMVVKMYMCMYLYMHVCMCTCMYDGTLLTVNVSTGHVSVVG